MQALAPLPLEPVPLGVSAAIKGDEPLLIASGGDDGDLSLARMVSRRPFSGYWEYHIEGALFTAPARTDHSGAGLFNADGELVGIGSLVVTDAAGSATSPVRGNMFVPVDLLKPILAEMRASRRVARQHPALARPQLRRVRRPGARDPADRRQPGRGRRPAARRPDHRHRRHRRSPTSPRSTRRSGATRAPSATSPSRSGAAPSRMRLTVRSVDRMKTLSRPQGV